MSEPLKSTHVRLSAEADRALQTVADIEEKDKAEMARIILEEALLGRVHTFLQMAERYKAGAGAVGIIGEPKK